MNTNIIEMIEKYKLVAIIRGVERDDLIPLCQALYDGGVRLAEVTFSADGSKDQETAANIRTLSEEFDGRMAIGAGTVMTEKQVKLTAAANGKFIISPNVSEKVIKKTKKLGLISMPGALTPTEIAQAHDLGADFVKVFPAGDLGSGYIKAIKAPLSNIRLLAVGGIDLNNLTEYMNAGVRGVGIGSNIVSKDCLSRKDFSSIQRLASEYVSLLKAYEKESVKV